MGEGERRDRWLRGRGMVREARDFNAYFFLPPSSGGAEVRVEEEAGRPEAYSSGEARSYWRCP